MKENFESVKAQVDIKDIATYLLGKPFQGMYRFPGETNSQHQNIF